MSDELIPVSNADSMVMMTVEKLYSVAPFTVLILTIAAVGGLGVWALMRTHISSLKEFIEYLKQDRGR